MDFYKENPRFWYAFHLLFYTGMRSGEFLALTLNDFDLKNNKVHITKSFARVGAEDLIFNPKTPKSTRTITLPNFLTDIVKTHVSRLVDYKNTDQLFPLTKYTLQRELAHDCDYTGVKKFAFMIYVTLMSRPRQKYIRTPLCI